MHNYRMRFGGIDLRFSPDIVGVEDQETRLLTLNPRSEDADDEVARMALELGYRVLLENGGHCKIRDLEYVNLLSGKVIHSRSSLRKQTMVRAQDTALVIEALWGSI
jgi:hypothetical protein